jgi:hypothetical protein
MLACLASFGVWADPLLVHGKVMDVDSQAVAGAVVTVTLGAGVALVDTTGAEGLYEVKTAITGNQAFMMIAVTAQGYQNGAATAQVRNTNDSVADTVSRNFFLRSGSVITGDSLILSGTISTEAGDPIPGALVSVTVNPLAQPLTDSADAQGNYAIKTVNSSRTQNISIVVTAAGYNDAFASARIANPNDGVRDTVSRDVILDPIVYDTVQVGGVVIDSASGKAVTGALAIFTAGGMMASSVDSLKTDSQGKFGDKLLLTQGTYRLTWRIESAGYRSRTGTVNLPDSGVIDMDTVKLVAFTTTDSLTYRISGRITNAQDLGIGGAQVVTVITFDDKAIFTDTAVSSNDNRTRGQYSTQTRQAYQTGELVVTITVTADGFTPVTVTRTIPTSTSTITLDAQLAPETAVLPVNPAQLRRSDLTGPVAVYSLTGKMLGVLQDRQISPTALKELGRTSGFQVLLLRWVNGGKPVCQRLVLR